ncbi:MULTISPECIES: hypothetical protein [unclassified Clostridioides]|uniref:hypothetical protein n=1 Tax=unclassified Clostridioides TaxID=2635829 RepID=UPI001D0CB6B6|nr:hypothetical protein [Clostridioides sp. ES-S-0001-03]MCC0670465.1 hypothetical protein [Clostridioides sp. ES-S-0145-01]
MIKLEKCEVCKYIKLLTPVSGRRKGKDIIIYLCEQCLDEIVDRINNGVNEWKCNSK